MVNSKLVVGYKLGVSDVNGYQVDEFTHTWAVEHCCPQSHIYPGFTGNVYINTLPSTARL